MESPHKLEITSMKASTVLFSIVLLTSACAVSKSGSSANSRSHSSMFDELKRKPNLQLVDLLRTQAGIRIRGNPPYYKLFVKGSTNPCLYVVNGTAISASYDDAANIVDPYAVTKIKVVSPSRARSRYGVRGQNGVIDITTE